MMSISNVSYRLPDSAGTETTVTTDQTLVESVT